jgi:hypothetical protein
MSESYLSGYEYGYDQINVLSDDNTDIIKDLNFNNIKLNINSNSNSNSNKINNIIDRETRIFNKFKNKFEDRKVLPNLIVPNLIVPNLIVPNNNNTHKLHKKSIIYQKNILDDIYLIELEKKNEMLTLFLFFLIIIIIIQYTNINLNINEIPKITPNTQNKI